MRPNYRNRADPQQEMRHSGRLIKWRTTLGLAAVALFLLSLGCSQVTAASLLLNPKYVPRDFPINVVLDGPHGFHQVVHRRRVVQVPPGAVKVRVEAVTFPRSYRGVPAGSRAYPNGYGPRGLIYPALSQTFTRYPSNGEIDVTKIVYGTIVSARTAALNATPVSVTGTPSDPSAIGLSPSASRNIRKGQILAQAPTTALPGGLFDRVTGARRSNGAVEVSLKPATLAEAFPALALRGRFPIHSGPTPDGALSAPLSFDDSLVTDAIGASCPSLVPGWQFQLSGSFVPTLRFATKGRFLARASGELGLEVDGTIALSSSFASGARCAFSLDGSRLASVVNIMGIPVPVTGSVGLTTTLASSGAIASQFLAELATTSSIAFDGYGSPQSRGSIQPPKASGTVSTSGGELVVNPEFQVDLGVGGSIATLLMTPEISAIEIGASGCQVNFGLSGEATTDFGPQKYSAKLEAPQTPRYRCS